MAFKIVELVKLAWCSGMTPAETCTWLWQQHNRISSSASVVQLFIYWDTAAKKIELPTWSHSA